MTLIMTKVNDEVEVGVEIDGKVEFTLTVGVIPYEIGQEIQRLSLASLDVAKAAAIQDEAELKDAVTIDTDSINKMVTLICKYGIRNLVGIEFADGSAVPCLTEKEEVTGFTILAPETLRLYLTNKQILNLATNHIQQINRMEVGNFIKGGFKTLKEAQEDSKEIPLGVSSAQ